MSAYDTKETSAEHDRMSAFVKKGLGTFGVSYHETFDLFWIKGPLRCKANNFFGYDLEQRVVGIFKVVRIRSNAVVISFIVSGPNVAPEIYFLIGINPLEKSTPKSPIEESTPNWNSQPFLCSAMDPRCGTRICVAPG